MTPKLTHILLHAKKFTSQIMLQMPKQTNLGLLIRTFNLVGLAPLFTVEKIMTNGKCSQLFFYLGPEEFLQIDQCKLYNRLYKDMAREGKEEKKKTKKTLRDAPEQVLSQVYLNLHPNKKISLVENKKESDSWLLNGKWTFIVLGIVCPEWTDLVQGNFFLFLRHCDIQQHFI